MTPNGPRMTQNYPKWPKNDPKWPTITPKWPKNYARIYALFPQIYLTEKAVLQTFSLLECMLIQSCKVQTGKKKQFLPYFGNIRRQSVYLTCHCPIAQLSRGWNVRLVKLSSPTRTRHWTQEQAPPVHHWCSLGPDPGGGQSWYAAGWQTKAVSRVSSRVWTAQKVF